MIAGLVAIRLYALESLIGKGCVMGRFCGDKDIPDNSLAVGNPQK
jgi:acetyltransferase-like isoleucine patch superfamily enzyme